MTDLNPRDYFECGEDAIDHCCRGCIKETGWLDNPEDVDTPSCAVRLIANKAGSIVVVNDRVQCPDYVDKNHERIERELELYEKRMRGDWS